MFDYFIFCLRTVYSRTVFFFFPSKLQRLKTIRQDLENKIRLFVEKYIGEVDPDWKQNRIVSLDKKDDSSKDCLMYLEKRAIMRKASKELHDELSIIMYQNIFSDDDQKSIDEKKKD